jgi:hypothetical protein
LVVLFSGSAILGSVIRAKVPEHHRSGDTIEVIQLVMSLLVTFAAIVLGLLTTSVKSDYDRAEQDRVQFAGRLTQLDRCMRNYGAGSELVRSQLRSYTAAVIASTWSSEPPPRGVTYPDVSSMARVGANPVLANIINTMGVEIRRLDPADDFHRKIADDCYQTYRQVLNDRWSVIEDVYSTMPAPFFFAVTFWMAIIFVGFGLRAPSVPLVWIMVAFCIVSVTSALLIILDLNMPYGGLFRISSVAMRTALAHMMEP